MKKALFFLVLAGCILLSCTKAKTDYEAEIRTAVSNDYSLKEAVSIPGHSFQISVEAWNGRFYKGYNPIRVKLSAVAPGAVSAVSFLPVMTGTDGSQNSGPHLPHLTYHAGGNYFSGYVVFPEESAAGRSWQLHLEASIDGKTYSVQQNITVQPQTNKNLNMTRFRGKDNADYIIALIAPQQPKVAENELVAGIYKLEESTEPGPAPYTEVSGYTLQLDPRMPEPSMGNHSSPNNKDLMQEADGLYHGVVNYTMTGNWTLNFIMLDPNGKILRGTPVSKDFTPGVPGAKSELHIDILF